MLEHYRIWWCSYYNSIGSTPLRVHIWQPKRWLGLVTVCAINHLSASARHRARVGSFRVCAVRLTALNHCISTTVFLLHPNLSISGCGGCCSRQCSSSISVSAVPRGLRSPVSPWYSLAEQCYPCSGTPHHSMMPRFSLPRLRQSGKRLQYVPSLKQFYNIKHTFHTVATEYT